MKIIKKLVIFFIVFIIFSGSAEAATLSQSSVTLTSGQSTTVYAYNMSNYMYVSNNSNPSVASVTISGNTVLVYANSIAGSTTATICDGGTNFCSSLYITVSGYGYNNYNYNNGYNGYGYNTINTLLGFTISNLTLSSGDSITLSSPNQGAGGLYVSNNYNPNIVTTSQSSVIPGCYGNSVYSITTGQYCLGVQNYNNYNPQYYSSSYIPGCYGNSVYSTVTGQYCLGGSGINQMTTNSSLVLSALAVGTDTITVCQTSTNSCSPINISVIR